MWSFQFELAGARWCREPGAGASFAPTPEYKGRRPKRSRRDDGFSARLDISNERAAALKRARGNRRLSSAARAADFRGRTQESFWVGGIHFAPGMGRRFHDDR